MAIYLSIISLIPEKIYVSMPLEALIPLCRVEASKQEIQRKKRKESNSPSRDRHATSDALLRRSLSSSALTTLAIPHPPPLSHLLIDILKEVAIIRMDLDIAEIFKLSKRMFESAQFSFNLALRALQPFDLAS